MAENAASHRLTILLMPLAFDFRAARSVFFTPASELLGVLGGFTPRATGVASESIYGNPMDTFIARKGPELATWLPSTAGTTRPPCSDFVKPATSASLGAVPTYAL